MCVCVCVCVFVRARALALVCVCVLMCMCLCVCLCVCVFFVCVCVGCDMFQPCNLISDPSEKVDTDTARPRHLTLLVEAGGGEEERSRRLGLLGGGHGLWDRFSSAST
jgi:hypothetical protein